MFDIARFKGDRAANYRYKKQLERLKAEGINTVCIEKAVTDSIENLQKNITSFVIYGEPQSGKTEMMIALTSRLLDEGKKIIIVLLNDNVELLKQNLRRFKKSGIDPDPKNFSEVMDQHVVIGSSEWILFCKKNAKDLRKLIDKLNGIKDRVILDDEADYASPNAKKNIGEVTRINALVGNLLGVNGVYIGVTATPARLDLNNTFDNANNKWVNFPTHQNYTGQDVFFPLNLEEKLKYRLNLLPDEGDETAHLRNSVFNFLVTAGHLNAHVNKTEKNYCMLIHTSGKRADHTLDYQEVVKIINVLKDERNGSYDAFIKTLWETAKERFGEGAANDIVDYIRKNISRNSVVVMNSDADKKSVDYDDATNPKTPFTIAIGGNIVSRGVTFKNLLSMFFTRDVKHRIQQDTYIQRARMFGSRNEYVEHFELSIPEQLFLDWHKCFVFHKLALQAIQSENSIPVWLEDSKVSAVASGSIDRTTVRMDSGEMSFDIFELKDNVTKLIEAGYSGSKSGLVVFDELNKILGDGCLPKYLIEYAKKFMPSGEQSIAIHKPFSIHKYNDANKEKVSRARGFMGTSELEKEKFPNAIHHLKIFYYKKRARIFYRYVGSIKFLKNLKTGVVETISV
ncbi:MAG: Z1 domain-containing protein [Candidatus Omnitrophica bacterium]|nr:Z1 domain-containing protein [Candidatus Omnitrophota bacterium]